MLYLGEKNIDPAEVELLKMKLWELVFDGSAFPDLRSVYLTTLVDCAEALPATMADGIDLAYTKDPRYWENSDLFRDETSFFCGLVKMEDVKIEYNTFLNAKVLRSLFGSKIIPKRLMRLEIVNCACLDPIKDLEALAILLQRGLQMLQFLRLHLNHVDTLRAESEGMEYAYEIDEHPQHHLCNVIRELGQKIRGFDLAFPFACNQMFTPHRKTASRVEQEPLELPDIAEEPVANLPQRLMDAGYRYRRLIFSEICREAHNWDDMVALASNQGRNISWEMLYDHYEKPSAIWLVSGSLPVEFDPRKAMQCPFKID